MKLSILVATLIAGADVFAQGKPEPACDSILQALDASHRRAVLHDIFSRGDGRNQVAELMLASNELAMMNMNLQLAIALKCPLPRHSLSIPGPYSKAGSACAVAQVKREGGGENDPCRITNWQRDAAP